jgi:hypothetical protein
MRNTDEEYFHDDPVEELSARNMFSKGKLKFKLAGLAAISFLSYSLLGSTFATDISMSSGRIEFGQGVVQTIACDNSVTLAPYATFANASGASAEYKLTQIRLTDMDTGCWGKDFIIKVYNATDATPLNLYQTGGATIYSQIRVFNDNGVFNLQDAGLTSSEITNITGGFQVTLFNSASPASVALAPAKNVYKISIESVNHDSNLTLVNLPSGSMNFVNNTYGIQYESNTAFNFGTGDFTVEAWAKVPTGLSNATFFTAGGNVNVFGGFAFWIESNQLKIRRNGVGADISVNFESSWRDTWHHYAAVRGNNKYGIYVDGTLVAQGDDPVAGKPAVTHTDPTVGQLAGFPNNYAYVGQIRNVRVVKGTALYFGANIGTNYFTPQAAPLSKVSGTVLLLLAQKPGNPTFDSSDYNWVPTSSTPPFTLPTYVAP